MLLIVSNDYRLNLFKHWRSFCGENYAALFIGLNTEYSNAGREKGDDERAGVVQVTAKSNLNL